MNNNERFGQIEAPLANLPRRTDRQSEQIDQIISILEIPNERHPHAEARPDRAEERPDALLAAMNRGLAETDRCFEEQNERLKTSGQEIKVPAQRSNPMLNTQRQTLGLMSRQASRTDEPAERIPTIARPAKAACVASKRPCSTKPAKSVPPDFFRL